MQKETQRGLLGALFSAVRLRVLTLFFSHPEKAYQLSEAINLIGSGRGAVQREIEKLTRAGILVAVPAGTRKAYQANRKSAIFPELHALILKTTGLREPLRAALDALALKIDVAFVYGSVAKGEDTATSDIDVMILGSEVGYGETYSALEKVEQKLVRKVNPNLMTPAEWRKKLNGKNPFITAVARQPKLFIIGVQDDLARIGQPR
jgi:predicted nucleotidyltransferase